MEFHQLLMISRSFGVRVAFFSFDRCLSVTNLPEGAVGNGIFNRARSDQKFYWSGDCEHFSNEYTVDWVI